MPARLLDDPVAGVNEDQRSDSSGRRTASRNPVTNARPGTAQTLRARRSGQQILPMKLPDPPPAPRYLIGRVTRPIDTSAGVVQPTTPLGSPTWVLVLRRPFRTPIYSGPEARCSCWCKPPG